MVSGGRGHHRRGQHFDSLVQGQRIASTHALLEQVNSGLGLTSRVGLVTTGGQVLAHQFGHGLHIDGGLGRLP
jgi:hypothetical protein